MPSLQIFFSKQSRRLEDSDQRGKFTNCQFFLKERSVRAFVVVVVVVLQENLFDLLSDTEKIDIMETFDRIDTNQGLLKKYFLDEQLLGKEVTNGGFP